jgi:PAS domain S-box-containing protein
MASLPNDTTMADLVTINGDGLIDAMDMDRMPVNMNMHHGAREDAVLDSVELDSNTLNPQNPQQPQQQQQQQQSMDSDTGTNPMTGAGAGPLPTGYGAQSSNLNAGSTLTEFTKRRNWSQRVLEELKDFLYILTSDRRFLYVSSSVKALTGFDTTDLVGNFILDFIHADDSSTFVREVDESVATGNSLRFFHRFRKADGTYSIFESHGHPHFASEAPACPSNNASNFLRGFFMMARPYPTKNAGLLDSFLEHKIENERLSRRIADLKREEAEELEAQQRHMYRKQNGHENITPSESHESETPGSASYSGGQLSESSYGGMPPPAKPSASDTALTQKNLDEANASSRPDSITDKMARYEGATYIEGIEMLTGLHYGEGERSQGISTGDSSAALIRGDAGIAIPLDKDGMRTGGAAGDAGGGDKKKKLKLADEYVCTDCGTLDSPEWRKGPSGPKTLCNACGLRWAKKEKKRTGGGSGGVGGGGPVAGMPTGGSGDS